MSMTKDDYQKDWEEHPMRKPMVAALILHSNVGQSGEELQKVKKIIESIADRECIETRAKKTHREFGVRKDEPIGVLVTIRDEERINELLPKLFDVKDFKVSERAFDNEGNFGFGITEHIEIPGTKYDPNLGVTGLDVMLKLERPGFRVKKRFRRARKIPKKHRLSQEEAIAFAELELGITVESW
ncbi:MAG: 50S ribosomal protein L5 [Candidatus Heimdallarchaeota archaeon]|nr:50S ribosomal protein L5 [Candidatus Heimdallarchaeota archaeon]